MERQITNCRGGGEAYLEQDPLPPSATLPSLSLPFPSLPFPSVSHTGPTPAKLLRLPGLGAAAGLLPATGVIESGRDGCVEEASSPVRAAVKRAPLASATTYVEEGT